MLSLVYPLFFSTQQLPVRACVQSPRCPRSASNLRCKVFANGMAKALLTGGRRPGGFSPGHLAMRIMRGLSEVSWCCGCSNWVTGLLGSVRKNLPSVSHEFPTLSNCEFSQILMIFPKFSRSWRASPISGDKNYESEAGDETAQEIGDSLANAYGD